MFKAVTLKLLDGFIGFPYTLPNVGEQLQGKILGNLTYLGSFAKLCDFFFLEFCV